MLLSVKNLHIQYAAGHRELAGMPAVNGLDLDVKSGEIVGVIGESGSGKSTLALSLLGLLPPGTSLNADRMQFGDQDLLTSGPATWHSLRGRQLSMVFQDAGSALDPVFTIGQQIEPVFHRTKGVSRSAAREGALAALRSVGFTHPDSILSRYPHQLSGGMKQRAVIAIAMACTPKLLIADEPSSALDVTTQAQVLNLLRDQVRVNNTALLLVSHDLGVIAQFCDRALVMKHGKVVEQAPVSRLFQRPQADYTRRLLDSAPRLGV